MDGATQRDEHAARRDHEAMHPRQEHRPASSSSTSSTSSNCLRWLPPLGGLDSPGMIAQLPRGSAALGILVLLLAIGTVLCHEDTTVSTFCASFLTGLPGRRSSSVVVLCGQEFSGG